MTRSHLTQVFLWRRVALPTVKTTLSPADSMPQPKGEACVILLPRTDRAGDFGLVMPGEIALVPNHLDILNDFCHSSSFASSAKFFFFTQSPVFRVIM